MIFRLALEEIEPGHWVAYALDLPGCFSRASEEQEAIARAPERIMQHFSWLAQHGISLLPKELSIETEVVERFLPYESPEEPDYLVNAFFEDDLRPLGFWDVEVALRLMEWSRQDLFANVASLDEARLSEPIPGDYFGCIRGILRHIANAENWYLERMELGLPHSSLPEEAFERLEVVRRNSLEKLPCLIGDTRLTQPSGERWSGRKIVRRLLWHERDHHTHIRQVLGLDSSGGNP